MKITDMDRAWAELTAGHALTDAEVIELKTDYEDWVESVENSDDPSIYSGY